MSWYAHTQQGACSLSFFNKNILLRSMDIERDGWELKGSLDEYGDSIGVYKGHSLELLDAHHACLTSFSETTHRIANVSEEICHNIRRNNYGDDVLAAEISESSTTPNPLLYEDIPDMFKRSLYVYFVIESSGRMPAITLRVLQTTIEELLPELKNLSESNNVDVRIQTITYNIGVQCLDREPVVVDKYFPHLIEPFGLNNFGEACVKLNSLFSLPALLKREGRSGLRPIVFYLIRSNPTDDISYGVKKLQQNQFYQKYCQKYVCFVGDEQDREMYITSLGHGTNVMHSFAPYEIIKCLQFDDLREN